MATNNGSEPISSATPHECKLMNRIGELNKENKELREVMKEALECLEYHNDLDVSCECGINKLREALRKEE